MARKISELFWELRARSEGLKKDIDESERHLGRFTKFVADNPMTAVAAFGTAMLGVGVKAVQMAAQVDGAMRQIQANLPGGVQNMAALREEITAVARESGRAKDEVIGAAQEIARLGVGSAEELSKRLRGVMLLADATGSQVSTIVGGLDQVMDAFGLSADEAVQSLAAIASAARGRTDVDALFAAFQAATPKLRALGIDANTATRALVALVDRGLTAKKAAAALNELDADGVRELAKQATVAKDALKELEERAGPVRESLDRAQQRGIEAFNSKMEELGNKILPTVAKELAGVIGLIDLLDGSATKIRGASDIATVTSLGSVANAGKLNAEGKRRLYTAGSQISRTVSREDLAGMTLEQLTALRAGMIAYENVTRETGQHLAAGFKPFTESLDAAIAKTRTLKKETKPEGEGEGGGGSELTTEQKRAIAAAREALAQELASLTPGKADDFEQKLAGLVRKSLEAGLSPAEVSGAARKMREQLVANMATELPKIGDDIAEAFKGISSRDSALAAEMARIAAEITTTLVDDLQVELDQQLARMGEQGIPKALRDAFARSKSNLIAAKGTGERVTQGLEGVDNLPGRLTQMKALAELEKEVAATALAIAQSEGTAEEKAAAMAELKKQLLLIEQKRQGIIKDQATSEDKTTASLRYRVKDVADALVAATGFAYGLAQAFGQGNAELLQMISAVGQISSGIAQIVSKGWSKMGTMEKLGAVGAIVGGAVAIGKAIFGGESAEERRRRAQQSESIARLIDTLRNEVTGSGNSLAARLKGGRNEIADARNQIEEQLAGKKNEAERNRRLAELNVLEKQRLDQIAREYAEEQARNREDYEVRRLRALGEDEQATAMAQAEARQREYAAAVEKGADALTLAALAAAQAAEAAQQAAEAEHRLREKRLEQASAEIEIMDITDPGQQLARRAEVMKSFGGSLAGILEGLDLTNPADVATLDQRVRELFTQLEDAPDSVNLAGLSIEELIQYLLELDGAADAVAAGVKTAADAFNEAVNTLSVDAEIAGTTDPTQFAQGVAGAAGGSFAEIGSALAGIDLSTPEGRAKAEAALQELYAANKSNKLLVDAIRQVLKAVRAVPVPEAPPEEVAARATPAGGRESIANAARGVTEAVGNRMADYLQAIEIGVRELPEAFVDALARFLAPVITGPVLPPPLPGIGSPGMVGAGGGAPVLSIQVFVQLEPPGDGDPRAWGERAGQAIGQAVNQQLADWFRGGQIRAGNLDRSGVS